MLCDVSTRKVVVKDSISYFAVSSWEEEGKINKTFYQQRVVYNCVL